MRLQSKLQSSQVRWIRLGMNFETKRMKRVSAVKAAGASGAITDRVVLDADERQRRRIVLTSENGTTMLLDFLAPVTLRDGDALVDVPTPSGDGDGQVHRPDGA